MLPKACCLLAMLPRTIDTSGHAAQMSFLQAMLRPSHTNARCNLLSHHSMESVAIWALAMRRKAYCNLADSAGHQLEAHIMPPKHKPNPKNAPECMWLHCNPVTCMTWVASTFLRAFSHFDEGSVVGVADKGEDKDDMNEYDKTLSGGAVEETSTSRTADEW